MSALRRLLSSRAAPWCAALVALVLLSPAVRAGYLLDDYSFQILLNPDMQARGLGRPAWDLFRFEDGDPTHFARNLAVGTWTWWTAPDFRLAFFRPLSSLMHAWEFAHLPAWAQHLHSLAWYAALIAVVGALHRRLLGATWVAGLATLFYAIDDAHAFPAMWISHRNALIALTLGLSALFAHDRSHRASPDEKPWPAWPAPLLFATALFAGEAAFGALAWIVAHALTLDSRPRAERVKALAPYVIVAAVWFALYRGLGYGAAGGGYYVDPLRQPFEFAKALATRMPVLLLSQFALPTADVWMQQPLRVQVAAAAGAYVLLALIARWMRGVFRDDPLAPFLLTGTVLCLVPTCATWASDRLLLASGMGAFALVARAFSSERSTRAMRASIVVVHVVIAALLLPLKTIAIKTMFGGVVDRAAATIPFEERGHMNAVALTSPDLLTPLYALARRAIAAGHMPDGELHTLAVHVEGPLTVRRVDARTLDVTMGVGFLHDAMSQTMRGAPWRFRVGETVHAGELDATPLALTEDGRPSTMRFAFATALEDAHMRWVRWEGDRFVAWVPPPVGASVTLAPIDLNVAMRGR